MAAQLRRIVLHNVHTEVMLKVDFQDVVWFSMPKMQAFEMFKQDLAEVDVQFKLQQSHCSKVEPTHWDCGVYTTALIKNPVVSVQFIPKRPDSLDDEVMDLEMDAVLDDVYSGAADPQPPTPRRGTGTRTLCQRGVEAHHNSTRTSDRRRRRINAAPSSYCDLLSATTRSRIEDWLDSASEASHGSPTGVFGTTRAASQQVETFRQDGSRGPESRSRRQAPFQRTHRHSRTAPYNLRITTRLPRLARKLRSTTPPGVRQHPSPPEVEQRKQIPEESQPLVNYPESSSPNSPLSPSQEGEVSPNSTPNKPTSPKQALRTTFKKSEPASFVRRNRRYSLGDVLSPAEGAGPTPVSPDECVVDFVFEEKTQELLRCPRRVRKTFHKSASYCEVKGFVMQHMLEPLYRKPRMKRQIGNAHLSMETQRYKSDQFVALGYFEEGQPLVLAMGKSWPWCRIVVTVWLEHEDGRVCRDTDEFLWDYCLD